VISGVLGVTLDAKLSFSVTTSFLFWVVEEAIFAEAIVGSSVSGVDETVCSVACEVVEEIATALDTTLSVDVVRTSLFTVEEAILAEAMVGSSVSGVDETVCSVACEVEEEIATVLDTSLLLDLERTSLFTVEEAISVEEMACCCVSVVDETVSSVACEVEEEIVLGVSEVTLSMFSEDEDVSTSSMTLTVSAISGISEAVIFWVEVVAIESVVTSSLFCPINCATFAFNSMFSVCNDDIFVFSASQMPLLLLSTSTRFSLPSDERALSCPDLLFSISPQLMPLLPPTI
jgi:hypothetical protein